VTTSGATNSQCLNATEFNFSIPITARILGIQVWSINGASTAAVPVTFAEQLLYHGAPVGVAQTYTMERPSPLRFGAGNPSDRWGTTLTASPINQAGVVRHAD
jgi:hypothetical protein